MGADRTVVELDDYPPQLAFEGGPALSRWPVCRKTSPLLLPSPKG